MSKREMSQGIDVGDWSHIASIGTDSAIAGLSQMVNEDLRVTALCLEEIPVKDATSLVGEVNDVVVGIYLQFLGSVSGQIVLAFSPPVAFELVDMLMHRPAGSTQSLGEMEKSALAEAGNTVGCFFLNAMSKHGGVSTMPSPTAVVMDMAGAIIDSVLARAIGSEEHIFVIRMMFSTAGQQVEGSFLVLPRFDSNQAYLESVETM